MPSASRHTRSRAIRRGAVRPVAAAGAFALLLSSCGSDDSSSTAGESPEDSTPTVFVTTGILGDITENVVGDLAEVEVLLPPGADPHEFEASAQEVAALTEADLVIANGLGLEERLESTLETVADEGVPVFEVGPEVSPIPFEDEHSHDHDDEADDHDDEGEGADDHDHEGGDDPHIWMDPDRMASAATLIAEQVAAATGLDEAALLEQADAYADEVLAADEEIQQALSVIPDDRRTLVTNHEAFGYFAERYVFEIVGAVIPGGSTTAEPSAAEIAELSTVIGETGVPAIFGDSSSSPALVEAIAAEVGDDIEVVELYSESLGEKGSGADTYIGLITTNAQRIADALG